MSRQSSLRVFVNFKDDGVVFAGEDVSCTITFKNVEATGSKSPKLAHNKQDYINETAQAILAQLSIARARVAPSESKSQVVSPELDEKDTVELSISKRPSLRIVESDEQRRGSRAGGFHLADPTSELKHSRSVSIISLGSPVQQARPVFRHERSSSIHAAASRSALMHRPSLGTRSSTSYRPSSPSPRSGNTTPTSGFAPLQRCHTVDPDRHFSAPQSPTRSPLTSTKSSPNLSRKTTATRPITSRSPQSVQPNSPQTIQLALPPKTATIVSPPPPPAAHDGHVDNVSHASKILSLRTKEHTPRESAEFYAHSNNSDETLVSEFPPQPPARSRSQRRQPYARVPSQLGPNASSEPRTETLMMGYVQIAGSFILDESLVNQAPFEEVKRKAVVGGQAGGGVVGIGKSQSESGLFGALSWGNIGGSIGGLLGSGTPSSIQEMKEIADSKSVPLITTPKSILFVDLKLAPGESKSYSYTFPLPRGLPPSYRGRAMKVSYNIQIVVQRPGHARNQSQQIKQVDIPFRVFSGVNNLGESLDHDVMSPYIILQEQAQIYPLENNTDSASSTTTAKQGSTTTSTSKNNSSSEDFQNYVNHLLTQPRKNPSMGILSPTAEIDSPSYSPNSYYLPTLAPPSTRMLIDHAIRQSTMPNSAVYSPSRYTIARSGVPIATLMLSRPALKLGDLLTCVLDFTDAQLPCYACEATLESSERVDPALAVRSPQSVERATRRVWGRTVESCLWALRINFAFQVPISATPGFGTTGVSLEWCLRLEIVIGRDGADASMPSRLSTDTVGRPSSDRERTPMVSAVLAGVKERETAGGRLLDVFSADDRGTVLTARRRVSCESFEVTIPIRVFGAAVGSGEDAPGAGGLVI